MHGIAGFYSILFLWEHIQYKCELTIIHGYCRGIILVYSILRRRKKQLNKLIQTNSWLVPGELPVNLSNKFNFYFDDNKQNSTEIMMDILTINLFNLEPISASRRTLSTDYPIS